MDSLALALAFYRQPFGHPELLDPATPLPRGVEQLLLLALDARLPEQPEVSGSEEVPLAARFFVQQVFFVQDASHYRVLGLNPDASEAQIKQHHRLLMRLFHPDRRMLSEAWADSYAQRINEAYTVLRRASQRHRYDMALQVAQTRRRELAEAGQADPATVLSRHREQRMVGIPIPRSMHLPGWVWRRLPETVLGGIALIAVLSVLGIYLGQQQAPALGGSPVGPAGASPSAASTAASPILPSLPMPVPTAIDGPSPGAGSIPAAPTTPALPATPTLPAAPVARLERAAQTPLPVPAPRPARESPAVASPAAGASGEGVPPIPRSRPAQPAGPVADAGSVSDAKPVALTTPTPPVTATPSVENAVTRLDLEVLASLFVGAYERGDIEALMALFADQVQTNHQVGKGGIRRDYQTLFAATRQREMNLSAMQWVRRGGQAEGHGIFEIRLEGAEQTRSYAGTLRFQVQKQDSRVLITGFFHRDLYHRTE